MIQWIDQKSLSYSQQHFLNHISYLKPISAKINLLLGNVFQTGDRMKQKLDGFIYNDGQNLFSMLLCLFKTFFLKINILIATNEHKVATLASVTKQISRVSHHSAPAAEIKNIDDDEEDVENADESDDCLLIGSWFEEEQVEDKKESDEATNSAPGKTSSIEMVLSSSSKNQTSLEIITLPSVLIYLMERVIDLTRLSGDSELVAVQYLRQSVNCNDLAFYIKQMCKGNF